MARNYWVFAESTEDFEVTKELGFTLYGVGPRHRRRAERMQPNDRVLFYVSQLRKWTATATITSRSFEDRRSIWRPNKRDQDYPYRVELSPDLVLVEEDYIDALVLAPRLEYLKRWRPEQWPLAFYDRLNLLPQRDFRLIEGEMKRNVSKRGGKVERETPAVSLVPREEEPAELSVESPQDSPGQPASEVSGTGSSEKSAS